MRSRLVCPTCGVYCREVREHRDEQGRLLIADTVCAYCGMPELVFRYRADVSDSKLHVVQTKVT